MTTETQALEPTVVPGPAYFVTIEGKEYPWSRNTITTEVIAQLGGWDPTQGVIEIDKDNNERTLRPGEVVELKPGHGFAKKIKFRPGDLTVENRIAQELALLRRYHLQLEYVEQGQWVRLPSYALTDGWLPSVISVTFQIPVSYPGTPPYGIYVPAGLTFRGKRPDNYSEPAGTQPPFGGTWGILSWQVENGQWCPKAEPSAGTNLLTWVLGFADRFREGA